MLSSPRRPSSTMRIFSSAERISRTVFSALSGMRLLACLIVAPQRGYDEPATLSYAISSFCPTSADGLHFQGTIASGINAAGQIVGQYTDASNQVHGFLYSNGTYTTLDDP